MRTEQQARAAWVRANWPVPEWGWDALPDDEKAAWIDGLAPTGCYCPDCLAGDDQWCCRKCHDIRPRWCPVTHLDHLAIDAWNRANAAARADYYAFPIAGRFNGDKQTPCLLCAAPTYSKAGICAACRKETP